MGGFGIGGKELGWTEDGVRGGGKVKRNGLSSGERQVSASTALQPRRGYFSTPTACVKPFSPPQKIKKIHTLRILFSFR